MDFLLSILNNVLYDTMYNGVATVYYIYGLQEGYTNSAYFFINFFGFIHVSSF